MAGDVIDEGTQLLHVVVEEDGGLLGGRDADNGHQLGVDGGVAVLLHGYPLQLPGLGLWDQIQVGAHDDHWAAGGTELGGRRREGHVCVGKLFCPGMVHVHCRPGFES